MNAVAEPQNETVQAPVCQAERQFVTPGVNILETKEGYLLEAEMPGVSKEGLDISVRDSVLTIVGRRQAVPQAQALYRESRSADFRRVFELDSTIETSKITARIDQGILTVTLPKAEQAQPRKITVS